MKKIKVVDANWKKKKGLWVCTNPKRAFKKTKPKVSSLWTPQQDVEVLPANDKSQEKIGWTVTERIGMAVVNPRGVAQVQSVSSRCDICEHWNVKKKACKVQSKDCKWEPNILTRIERKGW